MGWVVLLSQCTPSIQEIHKCPHFTEIHRLPELSHLTNARMNVSKHETLTAQLTCLTCFLLFAIQATAGVTETK